VRFGPEWQASVGASPETAELMQESHMRPKVITPTRRNFLDLKRKLYDAKVNRIRTQSGLSIDQRETLARERTALLFGSVALSELDVSSQQ
jgi:hypothetical protein